MVIKSLNITNNAFILGVIYLSYGSATSGLLNKELDNCSLYLQETHTLCLVQGETPQRLYLTPEIHYKAVIGAFIMWTGDESFILGILSTS